MFPQQLQQRLRQWQISLQQEMQKWKRYNTSSHELKRQWAQAFCILPKRRLTMQPKEISCCFTFKTIWRLRPQVSFCFASKTTQKLWLQVSFCFASKTTQKLWPQVSCCFMTMMIQQSWQRWTHKISCCFLFKTIQKIKPQNWLLNIPKHPFTSAKIAVHFVRENGCNAGDSTNTTTSLASALLVTLALQD